MEERMSLIVFSGTVDKLMAASIFATGGAAMGLEAFRKDGYKTNRKVSKDFEEYGPVMMSANQLQWFHSHLCTQRVQLSARCSI